MQVVLQDSTARPEFRVLQTFLALLVHIRIRHRCRRLASAHCALQGCIARPLGSPFQQTLAQRDGSAQGALTSVVLQMV